MDSIELSVALSFRDSFTNSGLSMSFAQAFSIAEFFLFSVGYIFWFGNYFYSYCSFCKSHHMFYFGSNLLLVLLLSWINDDMIRGSILADETMKTRSYLFKFRSQLIKGNTWDVEPNHSRFTQFNIRRWDAVFYGGTTVWISGIKMSCNRVDTKVCYCL